MTEISLGIECPLNSEGTLVKAFSKHCFSRTAAKTEPQVGDPPGAIWLYHGKHLTGALLRINIA